MSDRAAGGQTPERSFPLAFRRSAHRHWAILSISNNLIPSAVILSERVVEVELLKAFFLPQNLSFSFNRSQCNAPQLASCWLVAEGFRVANVRYSM